MQEEIKATTMSRLSFVGSEESRAKLWQAMAEARAEFRPIVHDEAGQAGNRSFKYANLEQLVSATMPALASRGIIVTQWIVGPVRDGEDLVDSIHTIIAGQGAEIRATLDYVRPGPSELKLLGALQTYLRRYVYRSIFMLDGSDDPDTGGNWHDNRGSQSAPPQAPKAAPKRQEPPPAPVAKVEAPKPSPKPATMPPPSLTAGKDAALAAVPADMCAPAKAIAVVATPPRADIEAPEDATMAPAFDLGPEPPQPTVDYDPEAAPSHELSKKLGMGFRTRGFNAKTAEAFCMQTVGCGSGQVREGSGRKLLAALQALPEAKK